MSRYTTFFLWCPNWEPLIQTDHPTLQEAIRDNRWNVKTPWCRFQGTDRPGRTPRTLESEYAYSTPETVQAYIDGFHCLTHQTPPEIWRRGDAIERRHREAITRHYEVTRYSSRNAPEELVNTNYYYRYGQYIHYSPRRLGRDKTLHFEWAK